jgi:hypothetical protein
MAKSVKDEADKIQAQITREQEKAQKKSLWSSIGGALMGLAAGVVTGGASWAVQGAAVGAGTYLGAHGGKKIAETEGGAKREEIKSDLWYTSEADKQNLAFEDYDRELNKSIQNRALAAGLLTAATVGGGKLVEKLKAGKAKEALMKSNIATETAKAQEGFQSVMGTDFVKSDIPKSILESGKETFLDKDLSSIKLVEDLQKNNPNLNLSNIDIVATESYGPSSTLDLVQSRANELGAISEGAEMGMDLSSVKTVATGNEPWAETLALKRSPLSTSIKSQFAAATPLTTEAAPTMMNAYMDGLKTMASDSMKKSILAGGAMGIYGYRPELQSLRPIQMVSSPYQSQRKTRTA